MLKKRKALQPVGEEESRNRIGITSDQHVLHLGGMEAVEMMLCRR
jgi:hypothetical protein